MNEACNVCDSCDVHGGVCDVHDVCIIHDDWGGNGVHGDLGNCDMRGVSFVEVLVLVAKWF
jgi:hypothetical protein